MIKTAVFTIVSKNYWPLARTLMQSLAAVHPEWERHVLLVDRPHHGGLPDDGLFSTTAVEELPLPQRRKFMFRYTIMELNTAAKPWMFERLQQQGYQHVIYLDPDILVLKPLVDVERMLQEGATAVLTPHLTAALADDRKPAEQDIMQAGAYNLGFLAVGGTPQAGRFIRWWQQKLEYQAVVDLKNGLFTDQKWIDLVPGMFEGVRILRDVGYNVAYWNLSHRPLTRREGQWYAGDCLLRFFHFSGFNPEHPKSFSKHQNRFDLESLGEGKQLVMHYAGQLLDNGYRECCSLPYAFGYFDDGTPIPDLIRIEYRENSQLQKAAGADPFACSDLFTKVPASGLPPLLQVLFRLRPDLSVYFPDPEGNDRQALLDWFLHDHAARTGIPERFIEPIRQAVAEFEAEYPPETPRQQQRGRFSWGGILVSLHYRLAGAHPSFQRLQQYYSVRSWHQFLSLVYRQARRYFHGHGNHDISLLFQQPEPPQPLDAMQRGEKQAALPLDCADTDGVNIIGYARSEHGVGQSLRLFSYALQAAEYPHAVIDFTVGNASRTSDTSLDHLIAEQPRYGINVFHINADQMPVVQQTLPADFFKNRYNIGFWHWELPELPDVFLSGFNGLDEVWTPTGFVHDAVSRKSPVPVVKIPHAIEFFVTDCKREDFGLPQDRFLFLVMYDFSSYQERKNPKGALEAFDRAFGKNGQQAALVIKTQNSHNHPEARQELETWLDGRNNVLWLDRTLTRQEVYNLESLCDCFLSMHRSEGFGLGPAEAMYLGKPVIATNWSGTTEFMRQDNSLPVNYQLVAINEDIGVYKKGQIWADPDLDHAAWLMRQAVDDTDLRERIGRAAQHSIRTEFSPLRIGRMQQERLQFIRTYLRQ